MSQQSSSDSESGSILPTAEQVTEYLCQNPDFFDHHPDALEEIEIHHQTGSAVSLIERQVSVLREENRQLKGRIRDLVAVARENDGYMSRLHKLYLELVEAQDLQQFSEIIRDSLRHEFEINKVAIALFSDILPRVDGPILLLQRNDDRLRVFDAVLKRRKPVCGRYHRDQMRVLFGLEAEEIRSMAVLPLVSAQSFGILALGSEDKEHFRAGMSTVFLGYMTEMITSIMTNLIHASKKTAENQLDRKEESQNLNSDELLTD